MMVKSVHIIFRVMLIIDINFITKNVHHSPKKVKGEIGCFL
jgi:hypothetical protein